MKDDLLKEIEAELDSSEAKKKLESYRAIAAALAKPEPELEALDLAARVRQNAAPPPRPRVRSWHVWSGALAAAAALVLFVALRPTDGLRAKGGSATSWAGVRLFREGPPPVEIAGSIAAHEGVLVSYDNLGPQPFSHLLVYAVDSQGRIAWLYPAWQNAEEDPASLAVQPGHFELPSLIHPGWAPGPITVHARFTRAPLHVRQVEAGSLPSGDFSEQKLSFFVRP